VPSQITTTANYSTSVPGYRKRTKAKPAVRSSYWINTRVRNMLADGRTVMSLYTVCDREELLGLWAEYAPQLRRLIDRYDPERLPGLPTTTLIDLVTTAILMADRLAYAEATDQRASAWDGYLSAGQWYERKRREIMLPEMDMFARNGERSEWRWHGGGWYGDAPRIIQEHLPREFSDVKRSTEDHVGIFWNSPWVSTPRRGDQL